MALCVRACVRASFSRAQAGMASADREVTYEGMDEDKHMERVESARRHERGVRHLFARDDLRYPV